LLTGIGMARAGMALVGERETVTAGVIPGSLSEVISPLWFLVALWAAGIILLAVFRQKRYRY